MFSKTTNDKTYKNEKRYDCTTPKFEIVLVNEKDEVQGFWIDNAWCGGVSPFMYNEEYARTLLGSTKLKKYCKKNGWRPILVQRTQEIKFFEYNV